MIKNIYKIFTVCLAIFMLVSSSGYASDLNDQTEKTGSNELTQLLNEFAPNPPSVEELLKDSELTYEQRGYGKYIEADKLIENTIKEKAKDKPKSWGAYIDTYAEFVHAKEVNELIKQGNAAPKNLNGWYAKLHFYKTLDPDKGNNYENHMLLWMQGSINSYYSAKLDKAIAAKDYKSAYEIVGLGFKFIRGYQFFEFATDSYDPYNMLGLWLNRLEKLNKATGKEAKFDAEIYKDLKEIQKQIDSIPHSVIVKNMYLELYSVDFLFQYKDIHKYAPYIRYMPCAGIDPETKRLQRITELDFSSKIITQIKTDIVKSYILAKELDQTDDPQKINELKSQIKELQEKPLRKDFYKIYRHSAFGESEQNIGQFVFFRNIELIKRHRTEIAEIIATMESLK